MNELKQVLKNYGIDPNTHQAERFLYLLKKNNWDIYFFMNMAIKMKKWDSPNTEIAKGRYKNGGISDRS